jgi:hypothetical protein
VLAILAAVVVAAGPGPETAIEPPPSPPAPADASAGPPPEYPPDYLPPEAVTPRPAPGDEPQPASEPVLEPAAPAPERTDPAAWAALGVGGAFFGGELEPGVRVGRIFTPQLDLQLEGGLAISPRLGVAVYLDLGVGGAGSDVRAYCRTYGMSCSSETIRLGLMLRDAFAVGARTTPWVALGTGFAYGHVVAAASGDGEPTEVLQYWGWEMLRVEAGVDWRRWDTLAVGVYAAVSYVLYSRYEDAGGALTLPATSTHSTAEAGLRFVFLP